MQYCMSAVVHKLNLRPSVLGLRSSEAIRLRLRMTKIDKNFVAKTERKFGKSIRVDWFSLQVHWQCGTRGEVDVTQNSSHCTNTRRNVKYPDGREDRRQGR